MQQSLPDDPDRLADDLPPLEEGDDTEGPAGDREDFLTPIDDASDLDDENASTLDIGLEIDALDDAGAEDEESEVVLDIAALLDAADDAIPADSDEEGPERFDSTVGIAVLPDERLRDAGVGAGGEVPLDELVSEELPELDDDGEGEAGEDADSTWLELPPEADVDEPPPWAPERWSMVALESAAGALCSVDVSEGELAAGGDALLVLGADAMEPRRLDTKGRIVSVARLVERGCTLYVTENGELWRTRDDGSTHKRLAAFARTTTTAPIAVCRSGDVVIARSGDGWMSGSADGGDSWTSIDVRARVIALSTGASPLVALARNVGPTLLSSDDGGSSWQQLPLDAVARVLADGDAPRVAAEGDVIVLCDAAMGIAFSADRGESFRRLPGTSAVTALCIGHLHGRPHVFAAQLAELKGATHVLCVDVAAGTAHTVAAIEGGSADDATIERVRVDALAWDAAHARLVAAGGAGLFAWQPPPSTGRA